MEQKIGNIYNSDLNNVNVNRTEKNFAFINKKVEWKSVFNRVVSIINVLLLIVNIYYICNYYPKTANLGFDYTGIIVGVLSILITMLLGWQIISNLSIVKSLKGELDINLRRFLIRTKKNIHDTKYIAIATSLAQLGISQFYNKDFPNAIRILMNALVFCFKIEVHDELYDDVYKHIIKTLKEISKKISGNVTNFSIEEIILFKDAASKTGDEDIINFVNKFKP